MGFLRRLFGGGQSSSAHEVWLNATFFTNLRDDAAVEVVGEAFRQDAVRRAIAAGAGGLPEGVPPPPPGKHKAVLVREPTNPYDRNAVAVLTFHGYKTTHVGYLSRPQAAEYHPLFDFLARRQPEAVALLVDAAIVPERDGLGVILHLGTPGECVVDIVTNDATPADHPWKGALVVFTGWNETTIEGVTLDRFAQIALARWAGVEVMPRLTKKTNLLVVADRGDMTGNLVRARDYGVPTVDEIDFVRTIGIEPAAVGKVTGRWATSRA
jgi:HIRAN domain-containing protein